MSTDGLSTAESVRYFIIARNPERHSALPYLLMVPVAEGPLWLKVREIWPRAARVYCHPLGYTPALTALEVVERVEVRACTRIGAAVDLVLRRRINKRSQFVFTHGRGRPMIFWQTARSAKAARPGTRIPRTAAPHGTIVYVDSRERYGYTFAAHQTLLERRVLSTGDYAVMEGETIIASVERKRFEDFATSLVDGSLNFAMAELAGLPRAAVAVEGAYSALLRHSYARAGFLSELLARVQIRYPHVPINFLESRKLAEEWTYQYLMVAYANVAGLPLKT
jgi:hypothetical protein